ncbi:type II toxin-antitoxin system RelE/ParE family toxin [Paenibacillus medicaginis]|uniref:Type II toxin-antitoxin system RelE/ParE family toxin n=1 Tax=Paenibacillus medicaginis TaxID=1470560 RepID=A0ABV5C3X2_9BACL
MTDIMFYRTGKGNSEVEKHILSLNERAKNGDKKAEREMDDILYTMERAGDGMPHSRKLRGALYELRAGRYRIPYFRWKGSLVLLTIFRKSTQQTPSHEIDRAEERMKEWIRRYG